MKRLFIILYTVINLTACGQINSNNPNTNKADEPSILAKSQKMDTLHFWKIMDFGFEKGKYDYKIKEKLILEQLIKLTPEQIQEFEIIFQQMNKKASTWGLFAAQTAIEGGSSDDRFYYFRCWLISLGQKIFDETIKNPDYLASLDIPFDEKNGGYYCQFEELIPMADMAYEIVTKKDPSKDDGFPRSHADKLGLFYDCGTDMIGTEWESTEELLKIVPLLCKKYKVE